MQDQRNKRKLIPTREPGIYRKENTGARGGKQWVVRTRYKGKEIQRAFATQAEAKEYKAQRSVPSPPPPPSREPFAAFARAWSDNYRGRTSHGITESTRESYRDSLERYAIPYFGDQPVGHIGARSVKAFITHLIESEPKKAPDTIRRILAPLAAMLAEAKEDEVIPTNPTVRVVIPGEKRGMTPKAMTSAQVQAVLAGLAPRDQLLFEFLAWTGVRINEALHGRWGDIEPGPVFVVREAKTQAGLREIALPPGLMHKLMRHRSTARFAGAADFIFASQRGTIQDDHNVRTRLRPVVRALGLPWVTPHKFRHSLATLLREQGYDSKAIARVLGHTDPRFTERVYIHPHETPRFDHLYPR